MTAKSTEVVMPLMGEGITEATLVKWLKQPGERLEKDEPLLEVSTDKVDTEIPSPASGFLIKTFAAAGEVVNVNATIAFISTDASATAPDITAAPSAKRSGAPAPRSAAAMAPAPAYDALGTMTAATDGQRLRASPLVRRMARDMNINLRAIAGRGLYGRITKDDMANFIQKLQLDVRAAAPAADTGLAPLATTMVDGQECVDGVPVRREKMTKMRRLIAEHMVRSVRTSPHATTAFDVDLNTVVALRKEYKQRFLEKMGFSLTFTHFVTHAAVQAIKEHPVVNCSVDGDDILFKDEVNIGLAVALESGLLVPVIRAAQAMTLKDIAWATNDLVSRARAKKLAPQEVQGGTFSITNPGGFGSVSSTPIINQPQVAILCFGAIVERPVVVDGKITVRPIAQLSLTFDHRVIDGEGAARFLATLKNTLESYKESPL